MQKSRRLFRLLFLTGALSSSIVFLAFPTKKNKSTESRIFYRLSLETAGFHQMEKNDFAQVRDTLDQHRAFASAIAGNPEYDWELNGLPLDEKDGYIRTKLTMTFNSQDLRRGFMGAAFQHPDLRFSLLDDGIWGQFAKLDITLPVPGQAGRHLDLRGWNLHLRAWEERTHSLV